MVPNGSVDKIRPHGQSLSSSVVELRIFERWFVWRRLLALSIVATVRFKQMVRFEFASFWAVSRASLIVLWSVACMLASCQSDSEAEEDCGEALFGLPGD